MYGLLHVFFTYSVIILGPFSLFALDFKQTPTKGLEHRAQNEVWRHRKSMKMVACGNRKSRKKVVWQGLGESRGASLDAWHYALTISREVRHKMGEVAGKLRPT